VSEDSGAGGERRRYESLRRTTQAQETRAEIARAARELFLARGWAATTVRDVAREAGVSVPTVYATYGNKTGLALALADSADLSADLPRLVEELAVAGPRGQLAAMVAYDRRLYERAGDVIQLVRDAGRTEPDLATTYADGRRRADEARRQVFASWPAGTLRADVERSLDIYAALCTIDAYTTLTTERGWSPDQIQTWWVETLPQLLLATG
jgi:AcrR family transcriptional regulator